MVRQTYAIIFFTLSGCGSPPTNESVTADAAAAGPSQKKEVVRTGNRFSDDLASRSEREQRRILATVVQSAGEDCTSAKGVEFKGSDAGKAMWAVDCADAPDHLVSIDPNSSTTVLSCELMKSLKGPSCWGVWKK